MFSQRNNPYCELMKFYDTNLKLNRQKTKTIPKNFRKLQKF